MPGPSALPKGGLAATPPANGVDVDKALAEAEEDDIARELANASKEEGMGDARFYPPGETPAAE